MNEGNEVGKREPAPATAPPITAAQPVIADLGLEIVSFAPFTAKLPASKLVPLLVAEINAQPNLNKETSTQRYIVRGVNVKLRDNEVAVSCDLSAGRRGFTTVLGERIYTPWLSASAGINVNLALSVENFKLKATETYMGIDGRGDVVDAILGAFGHSIYGVVHKGINKALDNISGQDLRDEFTAAFKKQGVTVPPSTRGDVRVRPDGLEVILS